MSVEPVNDTPPVDGTPSPDGSSKPGKDEITSDTKFSSIDELKHKAPKIYDGMLKSVANDIITQMRKHQAELKKKMKEMSNPH